MSQTFTSSADWSDYLHSAPSSTASILADHYPSAAAVSTPTADPNPSTFTFNSAPPSSNNRTNRVTKPARKRSRASRRTPTTLLSTDTSNFRAMVQQFTGGPSALGFGIAASFDHPQPLRVTDQQVQSGSELISSSPFPIPSSAYSFHFHHQPTTLQAAYGGDVELARRMIATSTAASAPNGSHGGTNFLY